jgi:hypothetical protein
MLNVLTKYGIPTDTLVKAVNYLNDAPEAVIASLNSEFNLSPPKCDALATARFVADAIFRGATADKIPGYVGKRLLGQVPAPAPTVVVMNADALPVIDETEEYVVVQAAPTPEPALESVKGKRGRRKDGKSAMCKAVAIIEKNAKADRHTILDAIVASGVKQTSAVVYLWRYNKGERS